MVLRYLQYVYLAKDVEANTESLTIAHIVIAGVINGHIACKSINTRVFAGTDRMHKRDMMAVGSWIGIALVLWIVAWIIAEAIPVFSNLLSLMVCFYLCGSYYFVSDS